jgi:transposase-like protein
LKDEVFRRQEAIRRRLGGESVAQLCGALQRSPSWFHKWWQRYREEGAQGLYDRSHAAFCVANRTDPILREAVVQIRQHLQARQSDRARYSLIGAPTISRELEQLGYQPLPALRTIARILQREGLTQPRQRLETAPPLRAYPGPKATDSNQVHQLDFVGPRYLEGQSTKFYYLVLKDRFDQAAYLQVFTNRQAQTVLEGLGQAWKVLGIPKMLQVDNGWEFRGSARWPRSLGKVIRLSLLLKVEILFIPEGEPCYNGSVENLNGMLDRRFVKTQRFEDISQIRCELTKLNEAILSQHVHPTLGLKTPKQYRQGKPLRLLPSGFDRHVKPLPICEGKVSFIRLVRPSGRITILGEKFKVGKRMKHQYVKATLLTRSEQLKVYFRGRILKQWPYALRK